MLPAHRSLNLAKLGGNLFGLHHGGAVLGERVLLAGLNREPRQFGKGMAQEIRLAARRLAARLLACALGLELAQFCEGAARLRRESA